MIENPATIPDLITLGASTAHGEAPAVDLPAPDTTGYLLLAAEIDGHDGPPSDAKQRLLEQLKESAFRLRQDMFANVLIFTAMWLPVDEVADGPPRFDLAVLVQAPTVESAHWLKGDPAFTGLHRQVREAAKATRVLVTFNARKNACEYGPKLPRVYVLMRFVAGEERDVVPGWGWTYRHHLVTDMIFNGTLRRYLNPRGATAQRPARPVMYRLA